jgi:hypothetical protein
MLKDNCINIIGELNVVLLFRGYYKVLYESNARLTIGQRPRRLRLIVCLRRRGLPRRRRYPERYDGGGVYPDDRSIGRGREAGTKEGLPDDRTG